MTLLCVLGFAIGCAVVLQKPEGLVLGGALGYVFGTLLEARQSIHSLTKRVEELELGRDAPSAQPAPVIPATRATQMPAAREPAPEFSAPATPSRTDPEPAASTGA